VKKSIVVFYVFCILVATAFALGVVDTPAFADVCYGKCGDPV
jgi:hypothetical protein